MLLRNLINECTQTVSTSYPEGEAREMVFALLEHILGTRRHTHIIEPAYEVPAEKVDDVLAAVARLAGGEPLQYVLGIACFYGRDFKVNPSVLIPRPETEILCRSAVDMLSGYRDSQDMPPPARGCLPSGRWGSRESLYPDRISQDSPAGRRLRMLDLCTGSGCIAWTMALENPGAEVVAVDISDDALAVASAQDFSEELSRTGAQAPAFVKTDVLADMPADGPFAEQFDVILSNPPYVMDKEKTLMRTNVLDHEPHLALFVSDDDPLLFYRAVALWASRLLTSTGFGVVEINEALGVETAQVFIDAGFQTARVLQDFSGRDRFVQFSR
jgi:release factor glutamine methyltransferase